MKKLILSVFAAVLLVLGYSVMPAGQEAPESEVSAAEGRKMPASVINDISVPYDVTEYVEEEYPGHAVVQADEAYRNGQKVYRLRIDNDSSDYESRYLFYSLKWKLLDDQKLVSKPPASRPEADDREDDDKPDRDTQRRPREPRQPRDQDRQDESDEQEEREDEVRRPRRVRDRN